MTKSRGYQLDRRDELEAMAADKRDVLLLFDVDDVIHMYIYIIV